MAGTKFQYDESGATFYYFVITFIALVLIPVTIFYWPRKKKSDETETKKNHCHCEPCIAKEHYMKSKEPSKIVKQRFIKIGIIISWICLIAFAYKVAGIKADYVAFDPFEILEISAGASKSEIKKAYHALSLVYHPDKETGDEKRFMKIAKAYAALTDETARKNWEEYGNPDGPGAMAFGIALPSWLVAKENSMIVLFVYILLLMIALPIGVRIWWTNSSKYGGFKVLMDTTQLYYYYLHKTPSMILRRVVMVIAGSFEFDKTHNGEIVERPSDNVEMPQLIKEIPNLIPNNKEVPFYYPYSVKARALLYAQMLRIPLPPSSLELDKKYILSKCPYLIQEFVQSGAQMTLLALARRIQRAPNLETMELAMKLSGYLVQALWQGKNALLQLPHVNEDMLRHFINRKRNIRSMQQLAQLDESERRQMLRWLSDEQYTDVRNFIGNLPLLDVDVRSEVLDDEDVGNITAGALVTVTVTLTRRNMSALFSDNAQPSNAESLLEDDVADEQDGDQPAEATSAATNKAVPTKPNRGWEKVGKSKGKKGKGKNKPKPPPTRGGRAPPPPAVKAAPPSPNAAAPPKAQPKAHNKATESDSESNEDDEHNQASGSDVDSDDAGTDTAMENGGLNLNPANTDEDDDDDWDSDIKPDVPKKEILATVSKISHSVHCPYFPEDKQEHWWIYISDRKKPANLITVPFFMTNLVEKEEVELKLTAPAKPGTYQYMVNVRCDSYVDMDYFKTIKLDVKEAPKQIESHPQWDISEDEEEHDEDDDSAVSDSDLLDTDDDDDAGSDASAKDEEEEEE